jgi:hypothetical protein
MKACLASNKRIKAYKNKYNNTGAKLPPTHDLVKNKPKKPINTPITNIDLDLHNYA